ncbi:hypothetical protein FNV43_RR16047 [Rhamnella rubrinervis]|uniref:Uncharacterized protein n=1 Tax=Rhamnella rubrinervis TaxID=2594499 RepID=A0A8K0E4M2_9ROSA|nr:hypothetical protein FNV43_RR16047 [Rhamnella rubrinervis]
MKTARTVVVVILDIIMVALPNFCAIKLLMECSMKISSLALTGLKVVTKILFPVSTKKCSPSYEKQAIS